VAANIVEAGAYYDPEAAEAGSPSQGGTGGHAVCVCKIRYSWREEASARGGRACKRMTAPQIRLPRLDPLS